MKKILKYLLALLMLFVTAQANAQVKDDPPTNIVYTGPNPLETIEKTSCDYSWPVKTPEQCLQILETYGSIIPCTSCGELVIENQVTMVSQNDCQVTYTDYFILRDDINNLIISRQVIIHKGDNSLDGTEISPATYDACSVDDPVVTVSDPASYLQQHGYVEPSCWIGPNSYEVTITPTGYFDEGCNLICERLFKVRNSCGIEVKLWQTVYLNISSHEISADKTEMNELKVYGCSVDEVPAPLTDVQEFADYGVKIDFDCLDETTTSVTYEDSGQSTMDGYLQVDRTYHIIDACHSQPLNLTQRIKVAAYLWADGRMPKRTYEDVSEMDAVELSLNYLKSKGISIHYSCNESDLVVSVKEDNPIMVNNRTIGYNRIYQIETPMDYVTPSEVNEKWMQSNNHVTEFTHETADCTRAGSKDGKLIITPPYNDEGCVSEETPEDSYIVKLEYTTFDNNDPTILEYPDAEHENPFNIEDLDGGKYKLRICPICPEIMGDDSGDVTVYYDEFEIEGRESNLYIQPWISFSANSIYCEMYGYHFLAATSKQEEVNIILNQNSDWVYNWETNYGEFMAYCDEPNYSGQEWSINASVNWAYMFGHQFMRDVVILKMLRQSNKTPIAQVTLSACVESDNQSIMKEYTRPAYFGFYNDSYDPNMISGPAGYGEDSIISTNDRIDYRIFFENSPDFATAAASRVTINCPLHDNADPKSVRLGQFGFGDFIYEVPDLSSHYNNRIDLSDSLGVWLDVTAGLDIDKNEVYWIFQSIDPETGVEPNDTIGFLPVNDTLTGNGEGFVSFSITTFDDTETGDTITEWAKIVFDENDTVPTNTCTNMFDAVAPTSTLYCDTTGVFSSYYLNFKALANDDEGGSGIGKVELYVNADKTEYELAGTMSRDSVSDTLRYTYKVGYASLYQFVCIATDNVGNVEAFKTSPEFEFVNNNPPTDIFLSNRYFDEDADAGTLVGKITTMDDQSSDEFEYKLVEGEGDDDNEKFMVNNDRLNTKNYDFRCMDDDVYKVRIQSKDVNGDSIQKWFYLYANDVLTPEVTDIYEKLCFGETVLFGGEELSDEGIYYDTLATIHGCDSVLKLNIIHYPDPVITYYDEPNCEGEDFEYEDFLIPWDSIENNFIASWNRKNDTTLVFKMDVQNVDGCSDTLWLNMLLHPKKYDSHDITICENGLPFRYGDSLFSEAGTKQVHFTSVDGCDSIVTVNLTVEPAYYNVQIKDTICDNEEYVIFNDTLTTEGMHFVIGKTNIHNCDSVVCVDLAVLPTASKIFDLNVCSSHLPMVYEGFSIPADTTSCTMYRYETAKNGCDSIVTLDLTVRDADTQITDFEGGWYWYSTYLDLNEIDGLQALKDSLGSKGEQIKSQLGPFITYSNGVWMGTLTSINNEQMYMVRTTDTANVDLFSCLTTGSEHPITIKKNWNWIGYVSQYANSTTAALSSITPQEGDIIKSYENGFAVYYEMFGGWFGSLTQMQPGIGYMYYSNNSSDITLTYPEPAKDEGEQFKPLPTHWNTIAGKYPNNMTFIGKITINNIPATTDNLEVGVFHNGEVRGSGRAMLMEGLGTYRLFIQVYGEKGDELTFKLHDHEHNCEFDATCFDKAYFVENANYGTLQDPYAFRFYTDNSGVDENTDMSRELTLFPNPANSNTRVLVYCDFTPEERDGLVIEVYNAIGVRIQQIEPTRFPVQLYEIENAGSYTVRVTTGTGRTLVKKLVTTR